MYVYVYSYYVPEHKVVVYTCFNAGKICVLNFVLKNVHSETLQFADVCLKVKFIFKYSLR